RSRTRAASLRLRRHRTLGHWGRPGSACTVSHSYLCSSTPPPLTPPLFPYTTLFRSTTASCSAVSTTAATAPESPTIHCTCSALEDRKSTRLNSSHQIISYAVFCLKKRIRSPGTRSRSRYAATSYWISNRHACGDVYG